MTYDKTNKTEHPIKKTEKEYETFILDNIDVISENCKWGNIKNIENQSSDSAKNHNENKNNNYQV